MSDKQMDLHSFLADETRPFFEKLKKAFDNDFDYWDQRGNKPNLGIDAFKIFLSLVEGPINPRWEPRSSKAGKHGLTGQSDVFNFEHSMGIMGIQKTFYCKGYFYDRDNLYGVTIQSFRYV